MSTSTNPTREDLIAGVAHIDAVLGKLAPLLARCAPAGESAKAFALLAGACADLGKAREETIHAYACFGVRPT